MGMKSEDIKHHIMAVLSEAEKRLTLEDYHRLLTQVSFLTSIKAEVIKETLTETVQKMIDVKKKGVKK